MLSTSSVYPILSTSPLVTNSTHYLWICDPPNPSVPIWYIRFCTCRKSCVCVCFFLAIIRTHIRNDSFQQKVIILNVSNLPCVVWMLPIQPYAILNATECRHTELVLENVYIYKKKNKIDMSIQSYIEIGPNPNSLYIRTPNLLTT